MHWQNSRNDLNMTSMIDNLGKMSNVNQWFVYYLYPDPLRPDKFKKLPVSPNGPTRNPVTGRLEGIALNSPRNWQPFASVCSDVMRLNAQGFEGTGTFVPGFCITEDDPYFFLDLDLYDYDQPQREAIAAQWIAYMGGCFVELSSSGKGYHLIGTYNPPLADHVTRSLEREAYPYLELYTRGRGIAFGLTGVAQGCADTNLDGQIRKLIEAAFYDDPSQHVNESITGWTDSPQDGWDGHVQDADLLKAAMSARRTAAEAFSTGKATFSDLWTVNHEALLADPALKKETASLVDMSDVEYHIAQRLAFFTGCNMQRIERLFRSNAKLYRPKWDEKRRLPNSRTPCNYLQMTIYNACRRTTQVHNRNFKQADDPATIMARSGAVGETPVLTHSPVENVQQARGLAATGLVIPGASGAASEGGVDGQLVIPGSTNVKVDQRDRETVFKALAAATDMEAVKAALVDFARLGRVDETTIAEVKQIIKTVYRDCNDKYPSGTIVQQIMDSAYAQAADEDDDAKALFVNLYNLWVYRVDEDRYMSTVASEPKGIVKEGVFNAVKRYLSEAGPAGFLILEGYSSIERLLQDRVRVRHVSHALYIPTPYNMPPIKVCTPHSHGEHLKAMAVAQMAAPPAEQAATQDALHELNTVMDRHHEGFFNTYNYAVRPDAIVPDDEYRERFQMWLDRVLLPLCDNRVDVREVILFFMTHNVKYPGLKIKWAPLLVGPQRTGKSTIAQFMAAAMGYDHVKPVAASSLKRQFSAFANGSAVVYFEELSITGPNKYDVANSLKTFITDPVVSVERKGKDPVPVPNVTNYLAFSNKEDAIPLENDEERWFVVRLPAYNIETVFTMLNVQSASEKDALFAEVYKLIGTDRRNGMMRHMLLNRRTRLESITRHSLPFQTEEKARMRLAAGSGYMDVINEMLEGQFSKYINRDYICVEALREAFAGAELRQMGWPRFSPKMVVRALCDMGYGYKCRPSAGRTKPSTVYARSELGETLAKADFRDNEPNFREISWPG